MHCRTFLSQLLLEQETTKGIRYKDDAESPFYVDMRVLKGQDECRLRR